MCCLLILISQHADFSCNGSLYDSNTTVRGSCKSRCMLGYNFVNSTSGAFFENGKFAGVKYSCEVTGWVGPNGTNKSYCSPVDCGTHPSNDSFNSSDNKIQYNKPIVSVVRVNTTHNSTNSFFFVNTSIYKGIYNVSCTGQNLNSVCTIKCIPGFFNPNISNCGDDGCIFFGSSNFAESTCSPYGNWTSVPYGCLWIPPMSTTTPPTMAPILASPSSVRFRHIIFFLICQYAMDAFCLYPYF